MCRSLSRLLQQAAQAKDEEVAEEDYNHLEAQEAEESDQDRFTSFWRD
jgi:hypothetical protein